MIRFIDKKIGDEYYSCGDGSTSFKTHIIDNISKHKMDTDISINSKRASLNAEDVLKTRVRVSGYYHESAIIFANKSEAIRFTRAQALREFNKLKEDAHKSIEKVKNFRKQYWEQLNKEWIDKHIEEIERIERESL